MSYYESVFGGGMTRPDYNTSKVSTLFVANNNVNKTATVQDDGYVYIEMQGAWTPCRVTINDMTVAAAQVTASNMFCSTSTIIPVSKGDVIKSQLNGDTLNQVTVKFIPQKPAI